MSILDPYATCKVRTGEYAVIFRYLINKKFHSKLVCAGCSERDAKLIAKLLNKEIGDRNDKE